ncbi:two-component hybrid sensor and regulator [Labilithrix luteola]|uniref:Two-component hybrid sensor and regulator n=1 Tax=Labilithrix luteola TaxID=1391654 RepID=A0A0K1PME7_9BACT|nr:response regulator [Labilithrix luteola]AKU94269.1 two-component hybrid sensor and regulator [Labilithrix luteola]
MKSPIPLLLIDDDDVDRMAVQRVLRSSDIVVSITEATDIVSGLEALDAATFDCVLVDYLLPGGDGLQLLTHARTKGQDVPFVFLTGHEDGAVVVDLLANGAAGYVPKSKLTEEVLVRAIRDALGLPAP